MINFIKVLNSCQQAFINDSIQYFLSCTNYKAFKEKLKSDEAFRKQSDNKSDDSVNAPPKKSPRLEASLSSKADLKAYLDDLTPKFKQTRTSLKDSVRHMDTLLFLFDQINERIKKIANCFGKAYESWSLLESIPTSQKLLFEDNKADLSLRY